MQTRLEELSSKQEIQESLYWNAVTLLNQAGYRARYVMIFTSNEDDNPGYIVIDSEVQGA